MCLWVRGEQTITTNAVANRNETSPYYYFFVEGGGGA